MKKLFITIFVVLTTVVYAGFLDDVSDAVDKTSKTINSVNSSIKHVNIQEISISNLMNNPEKYKDAGVKISGTVIGLMKNGERNYTVILTDGAKRVNCSMQKCPDLKLEGNAEFIGIFNGKDTVQIKSYEQLLE